MPRRKRNGRLRLLCDNEQSHAAILQSTNEDLSGLVRDFKKYTVKQILESIKNEPESRLISPGIDNDYEVANFAEQVQF